MPPRSALAFALILASLAPLDARAKGSAPPPRPAEERVASERVAIAGFPEPHTPGVVAVPAKVAALLGRRANLNRGHDPRTWLRDAGPPPAIPILLPRLL